MSYAYYRRAQAGLVLNRITQSYLPHTFYTRKGRATSETPLYVEKIAQCYDNTY